MDPFSTLLEQLLNPIDSLHAITSYAVWCMVGIFILAIFLRFFRLASQFTSQAATLLTSIGILGTFLGIVIGLQGVDLSNTATEESVRTLLGGMTLAFTSSLVGMALSIVYKLLLTIPPFTLKSANTDSENREVLRLLQNTATAADEQTEALSAIAKAIGAGDYSGTAELLSTMNDMLEKRTRTLVDTTVSQQRQIAQLNESMERLVQSLVEDDAQSLTGQMRGLRNELSDRHRQQSVAMTEVVDSAQGQHREQALQTQELIKIQDIQVSLLESQRSNSDAITHGLADLKHAANEVAASSASRLALQQSTEDTLKHGLSSLSTILQQLSTTQASQLSVQQGSHELLGTGLEDIGSSTRQLLETQTSQLSLQQSTIDSIGSHKDEMTSAIKQELGTRLDALGENISVPLTSLSENSNKQTDHQRDAWNTADEHLTTIKALLERSPTEGLIDALKTTIREFNEHISEQFGDNFAQLNTAVGHLLEWQENYRQQLGDMREQFNHSVSTMSQVSSGVETVGENMEQIHRHTEKIPEHMAALGDVVQTNHAQIQVLESHLSAFAETRDRAVEALPEISNIIDSSVQGMVTASESLTTAANESANGLKTATTDLNEAICGGAEELKSAFSQSLEGYVKATESINDTAQGISERTQSEVIRLYDHLQDTVKRAHESSASANQELIETQFENMSRVRQEETEAVMQEMARALTQLTGRFTEDYSRLVSAMGEIVQQAANHDAAA